MISNKIIFFSPLDWGLGHATRSIPLIADLSKKNQIILGVNSSNEFIFEKYYPLLERVQMPSYQITYSRVLPAWLKILLQAPRILLTMRAEHKLLSKIISKYKINFVISDNRYGLYNRKVESIIISHQLRIFSPVFPALANRINSNLLKRFNEVWVPDYADEKKKLAGILSDNYYLLHSVKYIGPQSLYAGKSDNSKKTIDFLVILSGVEPQRTILENLLYGRFLNSSLKLVMLGGRKGGMRAPGNITYIDFCIGDELAALINKSKTVICRSGYSTLMDLHSLGVKNMILIPTPGQIEQEMLAQIWKKNFAAMVLFQKNVLNYSF